MKHDVDVLIAGGGLNGPTLALALANAGLRVAVVDPRPAQARADEGFDGRAYALAVASRRLLEALDLWRDLAPKSQPIRQVKASQGQPGEGAGALFLHFDSAEIEEGPVGYMLEDRFLYRALLAGMTDKIDHRAGLSLVAHEVAEAGVTGELSDGSRIHARLLIGADGRGSGVARRSGIARQGWDYGQTALVAAIDHDDAHQGIAQQYFMATGPLAILPLPGNRSSVVWSETRRNAAAIASLPDDAFLEVLRPRFGDYLGNIALAGARFSYPLSLSLAERYVLPRIALVGDAAHGVHPVAGQGLNLGLRDVAALAETLVDAARRGEDIGAIDVLERYQGWRRFDATSLALGMDAVNQIFGTDNPVIRLARGLGMGAVTAVPALRRGFMRQAAGLSVDPMPRMLTGRPL
ncbi:UbiH/UbiF/VisC/COQ6 family ubiquinone biosynthesis hydroxylase [Paracoccus sp. Z330]|uniref:UbiH/UbiF/VisC/COQ6 family ubiquinone biosynthesis hydroxylase n=1 Tax=Paracoccus onchidii TaxID=3017813 RepID=A0ABT4ZJB3_9RHOB|nr:UbiH/UbiF/VisC/COQ6 family ubiquinone biosynthesis hydroxylase [Paracoccus onchidii]MDB6179382.1 UbiH/UbiF/VisC/COQ6 family ubiquinone biosynthesis hydroxylase [Paracoccus onchidii]